MMEMDEMDKVYGVVGYLVLLQSEGVLQEPFLAKICDEMPGMIGWE